MITRLKELAQRLSRWELLAIVWTVGLPFVVVLVDLLGILAGWSVAAIIVLAAYLVVGIALAAVAIVWRLRHQQPDATEFEVNLSRGFYGPPEYDDDGLLATQRPAWAPVDSDVLDETRLIRAASRIPRDDLVRFALRTKSEWLREPLAYLASRGRLDYRQLIALVHTVGDAQMVQELQLTNMDLDTMLQLARVLLSQRTSDTDALNGHALLTFVARRVAEGRQMSRGGFFQLAEWFVIEGRLDEARDVALKVPGVGFTNRGLKIDAINPFLGTEQVASESQWLAAFNSNFTPLGLEPIELLPSGPTPFDRLSATVAARVSDGPTVSIIMTCFRPDEKVFSTVASIVGQTWQNWELLVMDDASGAEFDEIFARIAAADPRIRVIRHDENRGTYVLRNEAIQLAAGELVTMQDSDDWAHPRRLELQAQHLLTNTDEVANTALCVRVTEDLILTQPRREWLHPAEVSLMFRKDRVVDTVGYFDSVRKGADREFRLRVAAVQGHDVPVVQTFAPLLLMRYTESTLSASDFGGGWVHPSRIAYRSAQEFWREQHVNDARVPKMPFPLEKRLFPVHDSFLQREITPRSYQLLVVIDGRPEAYAYAAGRARLSEQVKELTALAAAGIRVAIVQIVTLVHGPGVGMLAPALQALVTAGTIDLVLFSDPVEASLAIVRNASSLQTPPSLASGLTADRVLVLEQAGVDERGRTHSMGVVDREVQRVFGVDAEWDEHRHLGEWVVKLVAAETPAGA